MLWFDCNSCAEPVLTYTAYSGASGEASTET